MASIHGVHPPDATGALDGVNSLQPKGEMTRANQVTDTVEISTAGKLAAKIHDDSIIRMDLVQRVKAEIAAGTYETPERIDATVDRLMEELLFEV